NPIRNSLSQFGLRYNPAGSTEGMELGRTAMRRRIAGVLEMGRRVIVPALWLAAAMLASPPAAAESPVRVQVVFDGSGSMWGKIPGSSEAKFTLAREGLRQILPAIDG